LRICAKVLVMTDQLAGDEGLRKAKVRFGIEVVHSTQGIFIFQRKYVINLLKETCKFECKTFKILIEQNINFGIDKESSTIEKAQYQKIVEKLIRYKCG